VHQRSETSIVRDDEWTVTGWPVHELEWKREILRTVRLE
jgi:hypothetical protein